MDPGVDYSVAKGNTIKERAIKNQRVSPSTFFLVFPISISASLSIPLSLSASVHLSIYLSISISLVSYVYPFVGLSDLCIVPQSRYPGAHTGARVQVHIRECLCVYTTRRDPSLVRSHFKHLLYHDRSLGARPVRAFLARGPPSYEKRRPVVGTRLRWSLDTN